MRKYFYFSLILLALSGCAEDIDDISFNPEEVEYSDEYAVQDINLADEQFDGVWEICLDGFAYVKDGIVVDYGFVLGGAPFYGYVSFCCKIDGSEVSLVQKYNSYGKADNGGNLSRYVLEDSRDLVFKVSGKGELTSNFNSPEKQHNYYVERFDTDNVVFLDSEAITCMSFDYKYITAYPEYSMRRIPSDEWNMMLEDPDILHTSDPDFDKKLFAMLRALDALVLVDESPDWAK